VIYAPYRSGKQGGFGITPEDAIPDPVVTAIGNYDALAYRYENDALDGVLKWTASSGGRRLVLDTTLGWHHETSNTLPPDGTNVGDATGLASLPGVRWRRSSMPGVHPITDFAGPGSDIVIPPGYCEGPMAAAKCPVTTWASGGTSFHNESVLDRYQLRSVLTLVAEALGHHVVKVGADAEFTTYDMKKAYGGGVLYRESADGTSFANFRSFGYLTGPDTPVLLPFLQTTTSAFSIGGFIQDSWSVMDKVTINAGIRYDAQYIYNTADKLGLALPNQWSPRLGFIWDPTQAGRSRVFGSYARYFQNVPLDMADRALSGEPDLNTATRAAADCDPRDPAMARGRCLDPANITPQGTPDDPNQKFPLHAGTTPVDPDLEPSSVDEIVLGIEYEIIKSRLGLTYTRRQLNNIIEDMSRDEATTYFIGNPGKGIAKDFPEAVRDYDAVTMHFSRSFQDHWLAQASYTWSWLRGNYSGLFRPETGQLDPNITADFDLQSLLPNQIGDLPGDRRHQLKLFAAKDWVIGQHHSVLTGIGGRATSGGPTNYLGSHALYGPNEVFILERGSGQRLPWSYSVDLRAGYTFLFSKDFNLQAVVDVFNFLNFQETTSIDQQFTPADILPVVGGTTEQDIESYAINSRGQRYNPASNNPNFGKPTRTQDPRIVQLSVRATF
jgi:outer membrane receptor protein involved in Fe transport